MRLRGPAAAALASLALVASAALAADPAEPDRSARAEAQPCPEGVAPGTRCLAGRDGAGAYYWLALPPDWGGTLVVHAHGGPELGAPRPERAAADLTRWSVWTRAGYAYAASGYRQGGVAVRSAAADTERVRQLFIAEFGSPKRTVLHGQSWGAGVAAVLAEMTAKMPAPDARPPFDAVLLTSGVLGGGTSSYDFRLDLRVVYQAVCGNHPLPEEPAYPLWQGLPPGSALTRSELARRVDDCTGLGHPAAMRSAAQRQRLETILRVVGIEEGSLLGHLSWATWHFQDIVFKRLGGRNPFGNDGVDYRGSPDDAGLNARVARYRADPAARADFDADAGLSGRIAVPVLTLHAVYDPVAFVELESSFHDTMAGAGTAGHLVQAFTDDREHSYLADAEYVAAMRALLDWVERGGLDKDKPEPAALAARCQTLEPRFEPATGCRFLPDYRPAPLSARVPAR